MTFRDLGANARTYEATERLAAAHRAAELIARYPDLSQIELSRLIQLYRSLTALDMALLISDTGLAPKLDQFYKDHRRRLRTPFRQYAILVYIAGVGVLVAIWAATLGVM